jgi:HEAT repeat protein
MRCVCSPLVVAFLASALAPGGEADVRTLLRDPEGRKTLISRGKEVVPALAALLNDEALAPVACDMLRQIPGEEAREALSVAFNRAEGEFRGTLAKALAARRDPGCAALLAMLFGDEELRDVALEGLEKTPGTEADKELAEAVTDADPAFRARLIAALGRRGSQEAIPPARHYASDKHKGVRLAAIEALGRVADVPSAPVLMAAMGEDDAEIRAVAVTACLRMGKAVLVDGKMAEAAAMLARVLEATTSDAERVAALHGLTKAAQASAVKAIAPLVTGGAPEVRAAAVAALRATPGDDAAAALQPGLKDTSSEIRIAVLDAVAERADRAALPDVVGLTRAPEEGVRVAALRAIAAMPTPEAETVIRAALDKGAPAERAAAADACLALARFLLDAKEMAKAVTLLHGLFGRPLTKEQEVAALNAAARAASPASAGIVELRLGAEDAKVRAAAAKAGIAVAVTMARSDRAAAKALLRKILPIDDTATQPLRSLGCQVDIPARNGVVSAWWVIGAWPAPTTDDWETAHPPEKAIDLEKGCEIDGTQVPWQPVTTDDPDGKLNLDPLFDVKDRAVAYALVDVHLPKARDVVLEVGSDEGIILWLNGRSIYERLEPHAYDAGQNRIKTRLNAGVNRILAKVCEGSGDWAMHLRIRDREGKPVDFTMR